MQVVAYQATACFTLHFTIMKKYILLGLVVCACSQKPTKETSQESESGEAILKPIYITDTVGYDSDDPAIWINRGDVEKSLILGTDKMEQNLGGLYAFDLTGKLDTAILGIDRPNNVDLAYDFVLGTDTVDIAIVTERMKAQIRVLAIPSMEFIDGGGIPVFEDDSANAVMGVAIYKRPEDNAFFAIVSRKENPDNENDYLYQYRLRGDSGNVKGDLVRKFGRISPNSEIEAIAVDNELGYVYYSDEAFGVWKYHADPDKRNDELTVFGVEGFAEDREGISIYKSDESTGYLLISDQQANAFNVYAREGSVDDPHNHRLLKKIKVQAISSDGSEVVNISVGAGFEKGMFVAMSDNKTFEIYSWNQLDSLIQE